MVNILMATCNGQLFVEEQIVSIINQTYTDWRLYIRDDGSVDGTPHKIRKLIKDYHGDNIIFWENRDDNRGVNGNFAFLLDKCENADYYFFCDQDDVWEPDKLAQVISTVSGEEQGRPILAYHDMAVIDATGRKIDSGFETYSHTRMKEENEFQQLLTHNFVPGCSIMINHSLRMKIGTIPADCMIYDWWIMLTAYMVGSQIFHVKKPLSDYRIHENNQIGAENESVAKKVWVAICSKKYKNYKDNNRKYEQLLRTQIMQLLFLYGKDCAERERVIVEEYLAILNQRRSMKALTKAYKGGYLLASCIETAKFYLL